MKCIFAAVLVMMLCVCTASALEPSVGLEIEYADSFYGCRVVGRGTCTDEVIVIPGEYEGNPVVTIAPEAFYKDETLKKIYLPDTLTSLGSKAVFACPNLEYNEQDGICYLGSEENPFLLLSMVRDKEITELNVPEQTRIIRNGALNELGKLEKITLPEGLQDTSSLVGCVSLRELVLPASAGTLRDVAGCTSLERVVCMGMPYFDEDVFWGCTSLKEITFHDQGLNNSMITRSACQSAFADLPALTDIYFKTVEDNGYNGTMEAFYGNIVVDFVVSNPVTVHCLDGDIVFEP